MDGVLNAPIGAAISFCTKSEALETVIAWANEFAGREYALEDVVGPCRKKPLVEVRHLATWRLRCVAAWSFPKIGAAFGGRDHATIMHGIEKINKRFGLPANYPQDEWRKEAAERLAAADLEAVAEQMRDGAAFADIAFGLKIDAARLAARMRAEGYRLIELAGAGLSARIERDRVRAFGGVLIANAETPAARRTKAVARSFGL